MLPLVIPVASGSQFQHQVVFKTQATYYKGRDQVSTIVKWSWVILLYLDSHSIFCNDSISFYNS
jgi:hypothetical protein